MQLYPEQQELIQAIRQSIRKGNKRVLVQAWTGFGKTRLSAAIFKLATDRFKKGLFIAPRRNLVYQTSEEFHGYGLNNGIIMAGEGRFSQPLVQVASFDTLISRQLKMPRPDADIVIWDEAHYSLTKARMDYLKDYPLVIGLTATPALANGKGLGFFYTDLIESIDMRSMVEKGYLVPMRYFIGDHADLSGVKLNTDGDYLERELSDVVSRPEIVGSVYKNYRMIAGDRPTLIFAVDRSHARSIHNEFLSHGIDSDYIDANTPDDERKAIRARMESGQTKVVVNIGVMSFGTNWPFISCVIVARPTKNISAWIQMVGRGSRLYPGKSDCLVVYHGENFGELGRLDDPIEWSLDDKTTVKERKERKQKESKEPKEITCSKCKTAFKGRRACPNCGHEIIPMGEPIPYYDVELKEVKVTPKDKQQFYAELLGYCRVFGKKDSYALAVFRGKYNEWPYNKHSIKPINPSPETLGYIKHSQIRWSHARKSA